METILDQLYEQPEHYDAALGVTQCKVMTEDEFMADNDYDYREYLNDEIRDHIHTNGGYEDLSVWAYRTLGI